MKKENGNEEGSALTREQEKRLEELIGYSVRDANPSSVQAGGFAKQNFGSSPRDIYDGETIETIMQDIGLLREGLQRYIVDTRGEKEGFRIVKSKRIEEKEIPCPEPRTMGNLVRYISEKGVLEGVGDFIRGRTEMVKMPVEVPYDEKIPLNMTELREKIEGYVQAYLTQLNRYVSELGKMTTNINSTLSSLTSSRQQHILNAAEALDKGLDLINQLEETRDGKGIAENALKHTSRADVENYVKLKNLFYELEDKVSELETAIADKNNDNEFSENAERLTRAYEESLKNVREVGSSFGKLISKYVSFVGNLLEVSSSTNGMVEKLAESFGVIQEGMGDVKKIAEYTSQLYSKALMAASVLNESSTYVVEVEDMAQNTTHFKGAIERKCEAAARSIDEKVRPILPLEGAEKVISIDCAGKQERPEYGAAAPTAGQ